ncbi:MAG: SAM-dependent DNA methyltransferase, partial [Clostridiaceae bacterium]|nr:SAM-dependent DNA methyltransferase [Clostridiaceae bacterium]
GIQKKIREHLIDKKMLRGVVSMPSNIFATTGTNVSIVFVDAENAEGKVVLMDASKLGKKVREDGNTQKTVLSHEEIAKIIDTFNKQEEVEDFSVVVDYEAIKAKNLSFSPGQYFEVKIEYVELTKEEFDEKIAGFTSRLDSLFAEGRELEEEIKKQVGRLRYD